MAKLLRKLASQRASLARLFWLTRMAIDIHIGTIHILRKHKTYFHYLIFHKTFFFCQNKRIFSTHFDEILML